MEYVGERVSPALGNPGDPRGRPYVEPDVEVYIMEVPGKQAAAVAVSAAAVVLVYARYGWGGLVAKIGKSSLRVRVR